MMVPYFPDASHADASQREAAARAELQGLKEYVQGLEVPQTVEPGKRFLEALLSLHERGPLSSIPAGKNLAIVRTLLGNKLPNVLAKYNDVVHAPGRTPLMKLSPDEQRAVIAAWDEAIDGVNQQYILDMDRPGSTDGPKTLVREEILNPEFQRLNRRDMILKGFSFITVGASLVHEVCDVGQQNLPPGEEKDAICKAFGIHFTGGMLGHLLVDLFTHRALEHLEDSDRMRDGMIGLIGALNVLAPKLAAEAERQQAALQAR